MYRVLIAPLDWGLGHATRCIPIIRELQLRGCDVFIAGSGDSLELLRGEIPHRRTFMLPGYRPRYPRDSSMVWTMALQLPHFISVISAEHAALSHIVEKENIGLIISDNRYGCWSPDVPSVFITHQSNVLMPRRFGWLRPIVRTLNERLINRFRTCWIPDFPSDQSLAGDLIAFGNSGIAIKKEYIGWLSRFEPRAGTTRKYDVVAVFSGPEPQRTMLETTVMEQLRRSALSYRIVRGLPSLNSENTDRRVANFLPSERLQEELEAADLVIARSGFSTVMDLQALGKKAVFIPTPNQTEQEYLAARLMQKGIAFSMRQDQFNLATAVSESKKFTGFTTPAKNTLLKDAVTRLLA